MVLRLFRRKDPVVGKTAVAADADDAKPQASSATGAGTSVLESAQPQALKTRRASEATKGRATKPAPKPARKTKQPSKKAAKRGASGKATKPKRGK